MNAIELKELIENHDENEYIEFKQNSISNEALGEYISALSNSAAMQGVNFAYLIFGVEDKTHQIVGTKFDYNGSISNNPLEYYLASNLNPSISFKFYEFEIDDKRVVVLEIPSSKKEITEFKHKSYIRIGSSKVNLAKFPNWEEELLKALSKSIIEKESTIQNLDLSTLFGYYATHNIKLYVDTYLTNLNFYVPNTKKFNLLAFLMSNNNNITCQVAFYAGKSKGSPLYSLNDFGNKCLLITVDQVINFIETYNLVRIDDTNKKVGRRYVYLFDSECLREAVLNAFIHNDWSNLIAPTFIIFSNRIEIISQGSLPCKQTIEGFYKGIIQQRTEELAYIFLQLGISKKVGRGVTKIIETYGEQAFEIGDNYLKVTIPFSRTLKNIEIIGTNNIDDSKVNNLVDNKIVDNVNTKINRSERNRTIILSEIKQNKQITIKELSKKASVSVSTINRNIRQLAEKGIIKRKENRYGIWKIIVDYKLDF